MNYIATTKEQSQRLLTCGVSPETADMCWTTWENDGEKLTHLNVHDEYCYEMSCLNPIPAWSLSALLELLPKEVEGFPFTKWYAPFQDSWEINGKEYGRTLNGEVKLYFSDGIWIVDYDWGGFTGRLPQSTNPIEAVILALELLTANGYKLNQGQK